MYGFGLGVAFYAFNLVINVYTFCEFYLKMIKINYINPFLTNVLGIKFNSDRFIISKELIRNGNSVGKFDNKFSIVPEPNDFVLYTYGYDKFVCDFESEEQIKNLMRPESSKVGFLSCEIEMNEKKMNINLYQKNKYCFFTTGSRIDKYVLQYLVNSYYLKEAEDIFGGSIDLINNKFLLNIIDNNVSIITTSGDTIFKIDSENYTMVSLSKEN
tara:strand:+ start:8923 stop:9564 length:642 start_codon:yes stop_codon:yes gene_type:complete